MTPSVRRAAGLAAVCAGYIAAARLGLAVAGVNPSVTAIWPPTGIAIAAFVLPDDARKLAPAVLAHRVLLQPNAQLRGRTADDVVAEAVAAVPVPVEDTVRGG